MQSILKIESSSLWDQNHKRWKILKAASKVAQMRLWNPSDDEMYGQSRVGVEALLQSVALQGGNKMIQITSKICHRNDQDVKVGQIYSLEVQIL